MITSQFLKLLETGQFEIGISIDAITKEVYDKIRVNANYDEVRKNIETFINFQNRGKTYLNFNFCPLISNDKKANMAKKLKEKEAMSSRVPMPTPVIGAPPFRVLTPAQAGQYKFIILFF